MLTTVDGQLHWGTPKNTYRDSRLGNVPQLACVGPHTALILCPFEVELHIRSEKLRQHREINSIWYAVVADPATHRDQAAPAAAAVGEAAVGEAAAGANSK